MKVNSTDEQISSRYMYVFVCTYLWMHNIIMCIVCIIIMNHRMLTALDKITHYDEMISERNMYTNLSFSFSLSLSPSLCLFMLIKNSNDNSGSRCNTQKLFALTKNGRQQ